MNYGQSNILKLSFPNVTNVKRPVIEVQDIQLNPFWVTGFIAGEGSFYITTDKKTNKMRPVFSIGLNERDKYLLLKINTFFKHIGSVYMSPSNSSAEIKIYKMSNISILINHFIDYPLQGFKHDNFIIWCEMVKLL